MPTVRSRCTRIRLGPVATREIEGILAAMEVAEPPLAARLARIAAGRPGAARTLALAPDAVAARDEIARTLLDLLSTGPAARLAAARDLAVRAGDLARALDRAAGVGGGEPVTGRARTARGKGAAVSAGPPDGTTEPTPSGDDPDDEAETPAASASAAERRRAAMILIGLWRDLVRDLLVVRLGDERQVRDPGLLDDLRLAASGLGAKGNGAAASDRDAELAAFLARLDVVGELVEGNTRPEIALDSLLLGWPRTTPA
jgi:hypothetical protein